MFAPLYPHDMANLKMTDVAPRTMALAQRGILTRVQLAVEIGVKPETLVVWEKDGMPSIAQGKTVLYAVDAVISWMKKKNRRKR